MSNHEDEQNPIPPTDDIPPTQPQPANQSPFDDDKHAGDFKDAVTDVSNMRVMDPKRAVGRLNRNMIGTSGTRIFGELFDEEFLSRLTGMQRADQFDEMLRTDDVITMLLTARKNPILKAKWSIQPAKGETPEEDEFNAMIAGRCEHEFFHRMDQPFVEFLEEALSFVEQGYSMFERVHEIVDDPKFGRYIGYKKFGWRSQRTIERWTLNRDGSIRTVFQQADGDLVAFTNIPGEFITVFSHRKKGDNYEGVASLRPIFGNWCRKNVFLKLLAIGLERYAINTPVGTVPSGKENDPERTIFKEMLKKISSHQNNFMTLAEGWKVEFIENPFDVDKVVKAVMREDEGMVKSFVANHLNLGQGGSGGAYALGTDLSDQFLSIIENDAEIIIRRFDKDIIREFVDFNFGKQHLYPTMSVTGINDKFSKEFSEILKTLADAKYLSATENIEVWLREKLGIPKLLEEDKEIVSEPEQITPGAPLTTPPIEEGFPSPEEELKELSLNGAQISSLVAIITAVALGQLPRETGLEIITTSFPIDNQKADKIMGEVGRSFVIQKPEAAAFSERLKEALMNESVIELADQKTKFKIKNQLETSSRALAESMQEEIRARGQAIINSLARRLQGKPKSSWLRIIRDKSALPAVGDYKKKLKRSLAETAARAISQARNEVPGGRKIEFCEGLKSRMTFQESDDAFKKLPKGIKETINTDSLLIVEKQLSDIQDAVLLQASSAVEETEDIAVIKKRTEDELDRRTIGAGATGINGSIIAAASDSTTKVYNKARLEFFQIPESLEKIEAFQFLNTAPVSPICQDLNGKIFPKNDPESAKFLPPLHPNCKSFIAPVFNLQGKSIATEGLKPSNPKLERFKSR